MYYKHLGMQQTENPSDEELIEILVLNKEDINARRIDFKWIHSHEFKYNGEMYDVVKKKEAGKQIFLYCINDTKEKELEREFENRVHSNSKDDKQRPTTNNYNFVSLSEPVQSEEIGIALVYECKFNYWHTDSYNSPHLEIPSPPPRIV
jgi:hypothetical protein